jgi:hypothetical protein
MICDYCLEDKLDVEYVIDPVCIEIGSKIEYLYLCKECELSRVWDS